jgi:hypothetical protein
MHSLSVIELNEVCAISDRYEEEVGFETGLGTSAASRGHESLTERKPFPLSVI